MESAFSIKNKTIVITGASSGLGRHCAVSFAKMGAQVILIARNEDRLIETFASLTKGNHLFFVQDLLNYDNIEDIIAQSVAKVGKISGFVHFAGIDLTLPLKSMTPGHFNNVLGINVIAGFQIAKTISKKKYLHENGAGFIFISSILGVRGQSGKIGYCSSKGALISGVRAMALELISKKIRVNCISPGFIETEMTKELFKKIPEESRKKILDMHPMGIGKLEDITNACIFLLSDASQWINGINLPVDGGYTAQ